MRLAIVSDMHIGYERFEEDARKQAREALERAADAADAILIAGDVFDRRAPKPEVIAQAINIFRDISRRKWDARVAEFSGKGGTKAYTDVPIIAIPGTHERVAEGKENVLGLLALAGLLVDVSESTAVIVMGDERVAVSGLGGVSEERVRECLKALDPRPVAGMFNVLMTHQSIYELLPFSEDFIRYDELPAGFDLYVNGHIHNRVEAVVHGKPFLVPGSTVLTQLKDAEQEGKGFVIFDTKTMKHEFVRIGSRAFVSLHIKLKGATAKEAMGRAEEEIDRAIVGRGAEPIVRLVVEGTLAKGVGVGDVQLRSMASKYAGRAVVSIDAELEDRDLAREIADIRENRMEGASIRDIGMGMFMSKLKEHEFDGSAVPASGLFEILSSPAGKEKVLKEASDLLDGKR